MEEKIKEINSLNASIKELESFLWLLEHSDIDSSHTVKGGVLKRNEFSMFLVRSYIWTGNDNPDCEKKVTDRETMNELSKVMKSVLISQIEQKKLKLANLIK